MRLDFPPGFMWGTAAAAHQVEGNNRNSDWWAWEQHPTSPVAEPSGIAIDQYNRFAEDVALVAELGLPVYRFSVEWARIEPTEGILNREALDHYRAVAQAVRDAGMVPMVTLNHFTLPVWLAARGGWLSPDASSLLAAYCSKVVTELGDLVDWYCTINEPGVVAFGGYLGALGFPPGTSTMETWDTAIDELRRGLIRSRDAVKQARPEAKVGATHGMVEYQYNEAGRPLMEFFRSQMEDRFFEVCGDDDFIGVQTYTREVLDPPAFLAPLTRALIGVGPLRRTVIPRLIRHLVTQGTEGDTSKRTTDMGYEYHPQAVAATVRRVGELFPGKDIIVTENGVATNDDAERVEFITKALTALHEVVTNGVPLKGYIHWSAFDNFEWALGYGMKFGLIDVDRSTQVRTPKPSARFLGEIARANALEV